MSSYVNVNLTRLVVNYTSYGTSADPAPDAFTINNYNHVVLTLTGLAESSTGTMSEYNFVANTHAITNYAVSQLGGVVIGG